MGYGFSSGPSPLNTRPAPINTQPNRPGDFNSAAVPQGDNGSGQHGALAGNAGRVAAQGGMTPTQVRAMQQFLNNHGFQVAQDGILGPQTKSAAAAFRANHNGGEAWSKANGIGVHPATAASVLPVPKTGSGMGDSAPGRERHTSGAGPGTGGDLQTLLASLLGQGGSTGTGYDPQSFGAAAAAPDQALVDSLTRQIGANPGQEAQNHADISQWYGLNPKASSYQLSVLGRLAQAKAADTAAATADAGNMGDLAKALAGSIGGSANDGSSSVLAAGADAAGMASAIGQNQAAYASNMDPLLRAEAAGAASREKASNAQTLLALQDQLSQAKGQSIADRAQGVMAAQDKNNALDQQQFANKGNLLSMLAQMQASGLTTAKDKAQIAEILARTAKDNAQAAHYRTGTGVGTPGKVNIGDVFNKIAGSLNIPQGSSNLPQGVSLGGVAHLIGSALQGEGIPKSDPRYQRLAQSILGLFRDPSGNPLNVPPGWFGPNTQ